MLESIGGRTFGCVIVGSICSRKRGRCIPHICSLPLMVRMQGHSSPMEWLGVHCRIQVGLSGPEGGGGGDTIPGGAGGHPERTAKKLECLRAGVFVSSVWRR